MLTWTRKKNKNLTIFKIGHLGFSSLLVFALQSLTPQSFAQSTDSNSDKIDLQKIQDQYWTAKEDDIGVVQNKNFKKGNRFFGTFSLGPAINDEWHVGTWSQFGFGYYFSEQWGAQAGYQKGNLHNSEGLDRIANLSGLQPDHNLFIDSMSVNALWVPFYGKISLLDQKIIYFDMQVGFGLSQMRYENRIDSGEGTNQMRSSIGYSHDVTQHFFISKNTAIRLDFKNQWCRESLQKYRIGNSGSQRDLGNIGYQGTSLLIGFTYFN